ncbi:MAG: hypothetical protein ACK4TO_05890 [Candidatus Nitrosotenuis sp.]
MEKRLHPTRKINKDNKTWNRQKTCTQYYKTSQQLIAKEKLRNVCKRCFDEPFDEITTIFSYEFPERIAKLDNPKIQRTMQFEALRAQNFYKAG